MLWPCVLLWFALLALLSVSALAQRPDRAPAAAADGAADAKPMANPLPADAHVAQTMDFEGKPLKYTATVGTLPVKGADAKVYGRSGFHLVYSGRAESAGDLCVQWWAGGGFGLPEPGGDWAEAGGFRG